MYSQDANFIKLFKDYSYLPQDKKLEILNRYADFISVKTYFHIVYMIYGLDDLTTDSESIKLDELVVTSDKTNPKENTMSKSTSANRYAVVSASSSAVRKTAATREQAREWKRSQANPQAYRILDRQAGVLVR